jgi:chaperonin GroES
MGMRDHHGGRRLLGKVRLGAQHWAAARGHEVAFVAHRNDTVASTTVAPSDDSSTEGSSKAKPAKGSHSLGPTEKLPVKMLNDRVLVEVPTEDGERRSTGGILIPATAQVSRRLSWAEVKAVGPNVRSMEIGDRVLFNPEDRYEVEVRGRDYIILRERDVHAVAAERLDGHSTGLYL